MANTTKKVLHKRSVTVENELPKLPTSSQLEYGELAINYADGYETISIKNNNNEIVTFSSDSKKYKANIFKGTCETAAATTAKTVVCPDFTASDLVKGALIFVTFNATNTGAVASLTMNVNSTGAKPLKKLYNGGLFNLNVASELIANSTYLFQYDGTNWVNMTLDYNTNTTYEVLTDSALKTGTETSGRTVSAKLLADNYKISGNTITIANNSITPLTNDDVITDKEVFSGLTQSGSIVDAYLVKEVIRENELVTSTALNDLNDRANSLTASAQSIDTRVTALENQEVDLSTVASAVTVNGTTYTVSNGSVNIGSYLSASTEYISGITLNGNAVTVTNKVADLGNVVTAITINESAMTPTNGTVNLGNYIPIEKEFTISSALNDLNDRIQVLSGITESKQDTLQADFSAHTGNTQVHLPAVTSDDEGKIMRVVNGVWTLVSPSTIYSGPYAPDSNIGNNGDLYLQTT